MQVAIISSALLGKGGMETVFSNLYKLTLTDNSIRINYIFTDGIADKTFLNCFKKNDFKYHQHSNVLGELLFLIKVLKKNNYDCIIATSKKTLILTYYIKKLLNIKAPLISWIHFSLTKNGMYVNLSKYGDAHLAISRQIFKQIENMGVNKGKIYYLPNFFNQSSYLIKPSASNKFIYIGRIEFNGQKNLKELIDGLSVTLKDKNWCIDIYGDGSSLNECKNYIEKEYPYNIDKFNWQGWHSNPWKNVNDATALILTSKMEGMPMALLEAISRGLPVLSSNCPTGPSEIVKPGINGYLYKPGNLSDFRYKLNKLISSQFNRENVKQSVENFNSKNYLERFKKYLKSIKNAKNQDYTL